MPEPALLLGRLCDPAASLSGGAVWAGLLVAGAAGSVLHCAPMCGPFVLGQVADRLAAIPAKRLSEAHRLRAGLLLPYHLGRLTTYAALGALAALAGDALARLPWLGRLSGLLLLAAALLFLAQGLRRAVPAIGLPAGRGRGAPTALRCLAACRLRRPIGGYRLGLALGFLPCGFLYAALATAGASLSPLRGALAMLLFGLGTIPALMTVGILGHAAGQRWPQAVAKFAPAVLLLNAVLLTVLALRALALNV